MKIKIACIVLATGTLSLQAQTLAHRYSFTTDASDSVGSADLTLSGNTQVVGGELDLQGGNSGSGNQATASGAALDAIESSIQANNQVTFEYWFNQDANVNWSKILVTGDNNNNFLALTPRFQNGASAVQINSSAGGAVTTDRGPTVANGTDYYFAWTIDSANDTMSLTHGVVGGSLTTESVATTHELTNITFNEFNIGGAQYWNDGKWNGQIDEIRIWSDALSASDIAANFAAGPDTVAVPEPGALALLGLAGIAYLLVRRRR